MPIDSDHDRHSDDGVPVYATPGNGDWYDGFDLLLLFFSREKRGLWATGVAAEANYFAGSNCDLRAVTIGVRRASGVVAMRRRT
jgi:hypothetical protein